jgi:hypothetical protein
MNELDEIRARANGEGRYSPPVTDPAWKVLVDMLDDITLLLEEIDRLQKKCDRLNDFEQSQCAKLLEENGKLIKRLGVSPYGDDKIDELEGAAGFLKHSIKELQAELAQYRQAEEEGKLVIFNEKMQPLIWGDEDKNTILCPNCKRDLMGGYPDRSLEHIAMYQCIYCGQPINTCEALDSDETEAALAKEGAE